jgi:Domain of unknown function (DUF4184)
MPFTLTHIAAVLPIAAMNRRALPFSALVIGSMIPDFPMFVPRLWPRYETTHSISGIFTACVPLGLVCFLFFHVYMKGPLFAVLPDTIRRRCAFFSGSRVEPSLSFFALSALAIAVGAATHILWDSFTHEDRWGTNAFPSLYHLIVFPGGFAVPRYQALQDGCSVVLLPLMLLHLANWLARQRPAEVDGRPGLPALWKRSVYLTVVFDTPRRTPPKFSRDSPVVQFVTG